MINCYSQLTIQLTLFKTSHVLIMHFPTFSYILFMILVHLTYLTHANQSIFSNILANRIYQFNLINVSSLNTSYKIFFVNRLSKLIFFCVQKEKQETKVLNSLIYEVANKYLSKCHVNIIYDDLFDSDLYYKVKITILKMILNFSCTET